MEMIESLQGFVGEQLSLLAPVDQAWQPTDFLPDLVAEGRAIPIARVQAMHEGKRRARARRGGA